MSQPAAHHGALTQLGAGAAIQMAGAVFASACGYAATIVVSRRLGYDDLGLYAIGMGAATTLSIISRFGLDTAAVYYGAKNAGPEGADRRRAYVFACLRLATALGLVGAAALAILAGPVADYLQLPGLFPVLVIAAAMVPALNLLNVAASVLRGIKRSGLMVLGQFVLFPAGIVAGALVAPLVQRDVRLVMASSALAAFVAAAILIVIVVRLVPPAPSVGLRLEVLRFGKWFWVGSQSQLLAMWVPVFLLGLYGSSSDVGYFRVAAQSGLILVLPLTAFGTLFAPLATELIHQGDRSHLQEVTRAAARLTFLATAPVALALLLAPTIILFAFGENVGPAILSFQLFTVAYVAISCFGPFSYLLTMGGFARDDALANVASLLAAVGAGLLLIPSHGLLGAAWAGAAAIVLVYVIEIFMARSRFGFSPFSLGILLGVLGFAAAAIAGAYLVPRFESREIAALLLGLLFGVAGLKFIVTPDDRRVLVDLVGRVFGKRPLPVSPIPFPVPGEAGPPAHDLERGVPRPEPFVQAPAERRGQ